MRPSAAVTGNASYSCVPSSDYMLLPLGCVSPEVRDMGVGGDPGISEDSGSWSSSPHSSEVSLRHAQPVPVHFLKILGSQLRPV